MAKSKIEGTDITWNPVTGCTKISPGCENCYALRMIDRILWGYGKQATLHPDRLEALLHWRQPRRGFVKLSGIFLSVEAVE
jgi:protein gp37